MHFSVSHNTYLPSFLKSWLLLLTESWDPVTFQRGPLPEFHRMSPTGAPSRGTFGLVHERAGGELSRLLQAVGSGRQKAAKDTRLLRQLPKGQQEEGLSTEGLKGKKMCRASLSHLLAQPLPPAVGVWVKDCAFPN